MSYVTRYPNRPDTPLQGYNFTQDDVQYGPEDVPVDGIKLSPRTSDGLPSLILGCATFSNIYTPTSSSAEPESTDLYIRMTRLALQYGITAFDTAPHYHPSEKILGASLKSLEHEYPRGSYKIVTKCGKYSPKREDHLLDEETLRGSIKRSLRRFGTDYLDVVYIHDAEFNSSLTAPPGSPLQAIPSHSSYSLSYAAAAGLEPGTEGEIKGDGDERILNAVKVLRAMRKEGLIRDVGISGYPLPTLLRLSLLVLKQTSVPLDIIQTYSHQNLQNTALESFLPLFRSLAKVPKITNASPLNMGLLTTAGSMGWHPASPELKGFMKSLAGRVKERAEEQGLEGVKLEDVAISFGMRGFGDDAEGLPVVVGCNTLDQIHRAVQAFMAVRNPKDTARDEKMKKLERWTMEEIEKGGWADYSWQSPSPGD